MYKQQRTRDTHSLLDPIPPSRASTSLPETAFSPLQARDAGGQQVHAAYGSADAIQRKAGRDASPAAEAGNASKAPAATTAPSSTGAGRSLPAATRARMEGAFGADFSAVRVHEGDNASSLGAQAYAQGNDLHFAPGQYDPNSREGQKLLGHELAHVQQQRAGRVQAPLQGKGPPVVEDESLEHEADEAGDKAAKGEKVDNEAKADGASASATGSQAPIQGMFKNLFGGFTSNRENQVSPPKKQEKNQTVVAFDFGGLNGMEVHNHPEVRAAYEKVFLKHNGYRTPDLDFIDAVKLYDQNPNRVTAQQIFDDWIGSKSKNPINTTDLGWSTKDLLNNIQNPNFGNWNGLFIKAVAAAEYSIYDDMNNMQINPSGYEKAWEEIKVLETACLKVKSQTRTRHKKVEMNKTDDLSEFRK